MSRFSERAEAALAPQFDEFGVAAVYTPPGGGAGIACIVIRDREDREIGFHAAVTAADIVDVRQSELAAPAKGGTFAIGSLTLVILDDPRTPDDDPDRLLWRMTVQAS